jgi:hypothetical protein
MSIEEEQDIEDNPRIAHEIDSKLKMRSISDGIPFNP